MKNIEFFTLAALLRSRVHTRFSRIPRCLSNGFHLVVPNWNTKEVWTFFIILLLTGEAVANSIAVSVVHASVTGGVVFDRVLLSREKFMVLSITSFLKLGDVDVRLKRKWVRAVDATCFFALNLRLVIYFNIKILLIFVSWGWVLVHLFWSGAK